MYNRYIDILNTLCQMRSFTRCLRQTLVRVPENNGIKERASKWVRHLESFHELGAN